MPLQAAVCLSGALKSLWLAERWGLHGKGPAALSLVTGAEAALPCLPNEPEKWTLKRVITNRDSSDMKKCSCHSFTSNN